MIEKLEFFYALIFNKKGKAIQVAVFQLVNFNYNGKGQSKFILKNICHHQSKDGSFKIPLLVGGNVFANGENVSIWMKI